MRRRLGLTVKEIHTFVSTLLSTGGGNQTANPAMLTYTDSRLHQYMETVCIMRFVFHSCIVSSPNGPDN